MTKFNLKANYLNKMCIFLKCTARKNAQQEKKTDYMKKKNSRKIKRECEVPKILQ